jgi:hypothetical protein
MPHPVWKRADPGQQRSKPYIIELHLMDGHRKRLSSARSCDRERPGRGIDVREPHAAFGELRIGRRDHAAIAVDLTLDLHHLAGRNGIDRNVRCGESKFEVAFLGESSRHVLCFPCVPAIF